MFIRTKYNIFEVVEETDLVYRVKAKSDPNNIYSKSKCQGEVIAKADTIEELCDKFVLRYKNNKNEYLVDRSEILKFGISKTDLDEHKYYIMQQGIKYNAVLFGAIWTDKGLIYVAKMNEKGELELL